MSFSSENVYLIHDIYSIIINKEKWRILQYEYKNKALSKYQIRVRNDHYNLSFWRNVFSNHKYFYIMYLKLLSQSRQYKKVGINVL